jgi:hypothetical protein
MPVFDSESEYEASSGSDEDPASNNHDDAEESDPEDEPEEPPRRPSPRAEKAEAWRCVRAYCANGIALCLYKLFTSRASRCVTFVFWFFVVGNIVPSPVFFHYHYTWRFRSWAIFRRTKEYDLRKCLMFVFRYGLVVVLVPDPPKTKWPVCNVVAFLLWATVVFAFCHTIMCALIHRLIQLFQEIELTLQDPARRASMVRSVRQDKAVLWELILDFDAEITRIDSRTD